MPFNVKVNKTWLPMDLSEVTDGQLEGVVYVWGNPTLGFYARRDELNLALADWLQGRPDPVTIEYLERGNQLERQFDEMWATMLSADGKQPATANEVRELREQLPASAWLALTAGIWKTIEAHSDKQAKKADKPR